jgi:NADPH:quinone reductase-like Zn-dependent oxidoreductase
MQVITIDYFEKEKNNTLYDLSERIKPYDNEKNNEVLVRIDATSFNQDDFSIIQQLPEIIQDSGAIGSFQLRNLFIDIIQMNEYQNNLIKL